MKFTLFFGNTVLQRNFNVSEHFAIAGHNCDRLQIFQAQYRNERFLYLESSCVSNEPCLHGDRIETVDQSPDAFLQSVGGSC